MADVVRKSTHAEVRARMLAQGKVTENGLVAARVEREAFVDGYRSAELRKP